MEKDTKFVPGMLVALCETWPTKRVICIRVVKTVGKRDVKLEDSTDARFQLNGKTWDKGVYRWRAILPLTQKLLAQAETDRALGIGRALGHQLPDE